MIALTHRYLLLAGHNRNEKAGWDDFRGTYHTPEEAAQFGYGFDWLQIIDMLTMQVCAQASRIDPEVPINHLQLH